MKRRFKSIQHAINGIRVAFNEEPNFKIHIFFAIVALAMAWFFALSVIEWLIILFVIVLVLILEIVNSIIERIVDAMKPRTDVFVKDIKDMIAGVVMLAAIFSVIVGVCIFIPKIIDRLML